MVIGLEVHVELDTNTKIFADAVQNLEQVQILRPAQFAWDFQEVFQY